MPVLELFIFKKGELVFRDDSHDGDSDDNRVALISGMMQTLKTFPKTLGISGSGAFRSLSTGEFKAHQFETETGYQFLLITTMTAKDLRDEIKALYINCLVPLLTMNPLYDPGTREQQDIEAISPGFVTRIKQMLSEIRV